MDKSSSKKQSNSKAAAAAAGGSGKQVADVNKQLTNIDRVLRELDVYLSDCNSQIVENLKIRADLVQTILLLISKLEKSLTTYNEAENQRLKYETIVNDACENINDEDDDDEWLEILKSVHLFQDSVNQAQRQVEWARNLCTLLEPYLKIQMAQNETIQAELCRQLEENERLRREAIAKRKQLVKARNSTKRGKK